MGRRGRSLGRDNAEQPAQRAVEIAASSVDEAVRLALQQLNLNYNQVEIEVLEDPTIHDVDEALVRVIPLPAGVVSGNVRTDAPPPGNTRTDGPPPGNRREPEEIEDGHGNVEDHAALLAIAQEITEDLVDLMGLQAAVHPLDPPIQMEPGEPPTVGVDIVGPDLGVLIGRRGDTLQQFQYLVTLLVNKRVGGFNRVVVDVGGYKRRREEALLGLAERMAERVAQSHRPLPLEAMPPNERRVIHLALHDHPAVYTESQGEGEARKIVIYPR
ncbi:MAG: KH domain-containing protein [Chloroflexota bacterium]|nr:KH domain-containing protein [Chloroflexota bacterium]MDQ6905780.1 KH domain-containing protein [Chloroflexota bacterium]